MHVTPQEGISNGGAAGADGPARPTEAGTAPGPADWTEFRRQMPVAHLTAPCAQQARVDIMPRRHGPDRRTWLMRLGDDPQLFFHAPAATAFSPVDDLDRAVRHDFKEDLKVDFKVYSFATPPSSSKAADTGRLRSNR